MARRPNCVCVLWNGYNTFHSQKVQIGITSYFLFSGVIVILVYVKSVLRIKYLMVQHWLQNKYSLWTWICKNFRFFCFFFFWLNMNCEYAYIKIVFTPLASIRHFRIFIVHMSNVAVGATEPQYSSASVYSFYETILDEITLGTWYIATYYKTI